MDTLTTVALVSGILASLDVLCKAGKATYLHFKKNCSRARAEQTKKVLSRRPAIRAVNVQFSNEYHLDILASCPRQYAYLKKT